MSGFHSYNHGLVTSSKGMALEFVAVSNLDISPAADAACDVDDGHSNLVLSVIHSATGVYDVTLNKPYPPGLVAVVPALSQTSATTDLIHPRYDNAGYNATTGTFTVFLVNDDDSGAGVAVDGGADDVLSLILVFQRYTNL